MNSVPSDLPAPLIPCDCTLLSQASAAPLPKKLPSVHTPGSAISHKYRGVPYCENGQTSAEIAGMRRPRKLVVGIHHDKNSSKLPLDSRLMVTTIILSQVAHHGV